jgi:hypothetical protein
MKTYALVLGFLVSCLLSTQASAADGRPFQDLQRQIDVLKAEVQQLRKDIEPAPHAYSAAGCQPAIPFWHDNVIYNPQGLLILAPPGGTVQVECQIVRTRVGSQNGAKVDVVITSSGPTTLPAFCTLASFSPDGLEAIDSDGQIASLEGVLSAVIQLQVSRSEPDGYFELHCNLAHLFTLVQYVVREL